MAHRHNFQLTPRPAEERSEAEIKKNRHEQSRAKHGLDNFRYIWTAEVTVEGHRYAVESDHPNSALVQLALLLADALEAEVEVSDLLAEIS